MRDTEVVVDELTIAHLDEGWDIACEIPQRAKRSPGGWPECDGRPAEWIAWKQCPCDQGPRFTLLCDPCKGHFMRIVLSGGLCACTWCKEICPPPTFSRLDKAA